MPLMTIKHQLIFNKKNISVQLVGRLPLMAIKHQFIFNLNKIFMYS